ncbi:MAG TPA: aminopeptidase P N-terminal domain-containing protein [Bacteroidales bacterium]|nr:aminopeptidase P N-terminal domain-containing protein [Bacteroidales bacterium]
MRYKPMSPEFFKRNRKNLIEKLQPESIVVLAGNEHMPWSGDQDYPFRQNSDFYYLTGIDEENALLCLCPHHPDPNLREVLFIQEADPTMVIWYGKRLSREKASELSGIKTVKWAADFKAALRDMTQQSRNIYMGLNEYLKYSTNTHDANRRMIDEIKNLFPLHQYERLTPLTTELRLCKSQEEIDMIGKAIGITKEAFTRVLKTTKPGMMEYEVEAEITHEFIRRGASGHAYSPIVAGGENACVLHYITNDCPLKDGDLMLLDFGAVYGNYAADCSRTIPVNGKFTPRQKQCYNAVLDVLKEAKKILVPGTTIEKTNKQIALMLEQKMIELGLFSVDDVKNNTTSTPLYFKYYMHGASHFMGLDVHDVGLRTMTLKKGMVLTCEPGIYIQEESIGIRIENDILVDDEPINLMTEIPLEADEIEKLMR